MYQVRKDAATAMRWSNLQDLCVSATCLKASSSKAPVLGGTLHVGSSEVRARVLAAIMSDS